MPYWAFLHMYGTLLRCYAFSNIATEQMLYSEKDIESSMDKIETLNFHQVRTLRVAWTR